MKTLYFSLFLAALSTSLHAEEVYRQQQISETKGILGGGIAFGGDKVDEIQFNDGEADSIRAGSGLWFDLGFRTQFAHWAVKGTIGYKTDTVSASNGDASFSRYPLTLIASYNNDNNSFGAGFTHELSPEYDIDFGFINESADFKDATGLVLEYERNQGAWGWGIRYTIIDYDLDEPGLDFSFDGNNIGFFANWYF